MKYVILIMALLLSGCGPGPTQDERATNVANQVSYSKDERTGLCYAYDWLGDRHGGPVFTHVPCTAEVEMIVHPSGNQ